MRSQLRPSRRCVRFETLEARRLLVAEGDLFQLSRTVDTTGLAGTVSAEVRWGDGNKSAATVSAQPATGNVKIRFDYSLDTSGFFSGANQSRRAVLQAAADAVVRRFTDDLDAIIPSGKKQWNAQFLHPSTGQSTIDARGNATVAVARNLRVNANELVVFVGARNLTGSERGRGGPGGYAFPPVQPDTIQEQQEILAFFDTVQFRGETGAKATSATDFGPWGGSITFDNQGTDWYFGKNSDGIQPGQVDFVTVAMHELVHVLGFGRAGINKSWDTFSTGTQFTGPKSVAAYAGSGNPPLASGYHWGDAILAHANQPTLMRERLANGERQPLTTLDVAALDDIGWTLANSRITVTASHVYGDNGRFPSEIVLRGSTLGEIVIPAGSVTITNVAPSLTVVSDQTIVLGSVLNLVSLGSISDPGFRMSNADPPSDETFDYSVDWGDGSQPSTGAARIDQVGNATRPTLASFGGSHQYQRTGTFTVRVRVTDDDRGTTEQTFRVTVNAPPKLTLELTKTTINEKDGLNASELTVTRSGPTSSSPLTITLQSSDVSEATVPTTVVIPAGASSAKIPVTAIDDTLLDGDQTVSLSASGNGVDPGTINLIVRDHETLTATFTASSVTEDLVRPVFLRVARSNTDTAAPLNFQITGGDPTQLGFDGELQIPAGSQEILLTLAPVDDDDPEPTMTFSYTISAPGYVSDTASIELLDDEPPLFQNPDEPNDVNGNGDITAADALIIINELSERQNDLFLDPKKEQPTNGIYLDVNGDYMVTAADALIVINELNRPPTAPSESESVTQSQIAPIDFSSSNGARNEQDEDERLRSADRFFAALV